jgi:uncharacterized protein
MIVIDLNLIIYAHNRDAPQHEQARRFWQQALSGSERVGLAWSVVLGFLRLTTHPRILPRPLAAELAIEIVNEWMAQPQVALVSPTSQHWTILKELLATLGTAGNLTADAHLAALAIEHGARLYSSDSDFARFAALRWTNPLAAPKAGRQIARRRAPR